MKNLIIIFALNLTFLIAYSQNNDQDPSSIVDTTKSGYSIEIDQAEEIIKVTELSSGNITLITKQEKVKVYLFGGTVLNGQWEIIDKNNISVKEVTVPISVIENITIKQTEDRMLTAKGNVVIDANTTIGSYGGFFGGSGTSFFLSSSDGTTIWNIGAEIGFFVADNLAIKLGLGYGSIKFEGSDGSSNLFSYKLGLKYYIVSKVPFQVDYSGQSGEDFFGDEKPSYLGLQAGYAFFIGDMVSIEPALRYNLSLNSDSSENIFQVQVGFSIFF